MKICLNIIAVLFVFFVNSVDSIELRNEYTITPDDNSSDQLCANCLTLTQFALNTSYYLRDNTTLSLQPGNHTLQSSLVVSNIDTFTMHHIGHLRSSIQCKGSNELMFENVQNIRISNLNFTSCFNTRVVCVNSFSLSNTSFHGSWSVISGTGLELRESNALIVNCLFTMFHYGTYRSISTFSYKYRFPNNLVMTQITQKWIGGAMIVTQSNVTIAQGYFIKNRAQLGGAIYADNGSVINIHNTTFYSNYANSSYFDPEVVAAGGALYAAHNCTVAINESYFIRNKVFYCCSWIGGGVTIYRSSLVIKRSIFTKNDANFGGSAFLLESMAAIEQSIFGSCRAKDFGGALFILNSNITLKNSNATGNHADISGGVIYLDNSQIKIQKSNFSNNIAYQGGGVMFAKNGSQDISGIYDDNYAEEGGSIYVLGSSLAIKDSCFANNRAGKNGGGLYFNNDNLLVRSGGSIHIIGSLAIQNSNFVNNRADNNGGVLYLNIDTPSIIYMYKSTGLTLSSTQQGLEEFCIPKEITSL